MTSPALIAAARRLVEEASCVRDCLSRGGQVGVDLVDNLERAKAELALELDAHDVRVAMEAE